MRIAMVSEHASPLAVLGGEDAGGQNVHVAALSRALAARGHDVVVYTRRDSSDLPVRCELSAGVEVVNVPAGPPRTVPKDDLVPYLGALAAGMAQDWSTRPPDLVHAHFWMSGLATIDALHRAGLGVPSVQTFHALGAVKRRYQGANDTSPRDRVRVESELLRRMTGVVATCRDEVRELLAMGAEPGRLHVVPCGVDLDQFRPEGRRLSPWSSGTRRLLSLGRLVERKGIETAIDAMVDLPDAELVIAGGPAACDLQHDSDVARLRRRAADRHVSQRVRLIGRVNGPDAAALLRAAEVLVAVPWYEPFGIVPLEAQACGTPVVASAVGGMLDTVRPGVTGAHVRPRDPTAVARAVRSLLADPRRLREIGEAGAARIRGRYSWAQVAAETEGVYRQLLHPGEEPIDVDIRSSLTTSTTAPEGSP